MKKLIKKLQICFHAYKSFRVGPFPLIACYCPKCGKVKYGNAVYYDGSVYQKSFKGIEAVNFVKEISEYLRARDKSFAEIKQKTGIDFYFNEVLLREKYETIEEYDRIADVLLNAH
jgi:hypothetical protein